MSAIAWIFAALLALALAAGVRHTTSQPANPDHPAQYDQGGDPPPTPGGGG